MTTKQKHHRKIYRRKNRVERSEGYTQGSTCRICHQEIQRAVYEGEQPSEWWHIFPSLDMKHRAIPNNILNRIVTLLKEF